MQASVSDPAGNNGTRSTLLTLEHASDDELHATASQHRSIRQAALGDDPEPGPGG
jgi:hypothetical protein